MNRTRLATLATAFTAGISLAFMGTGGASAAPVTSAPLAPAVYGADAGGAVIVVLADQHTGLALKAQGTARTSATRSDQRSIVSAIKAGGGTDIRQLVSVNAVAAHLSAAEVERLRADPAVAKILPDATITVDPASSVPKAKPAKLNPALCPADPAKPFTEPEALSDVRASSDDPKAGAEGNDIATGQGVIVANEGINDLAGNPNFIRKDGTPVVLDAPDPTADDSDGEFYGDASSIAGQGTVVYDYSKELPYSGLPSGCTFTIKGVAPDASLVDSSVIDTPPSGTGGAVTQSESEVVAGIDNAVVTEHADIISESYGFTPQPGRYAVFYAANDAAIAAGVTVVVSSGDSGDSGTVSSPATDPLAIAVGATNTLRLSAQATGYTRWTNDDITPLSSGGTAPNNRVVDLVAPGYGGEAACNPNGSDCPENTQTEAFGGTSQSCPLVAGAAADVIQAYADSHAGAKPTPALVKEILTSTATDVGAPADQQGSGLLNVAAAVRAAQQEPGTTVSTHGKGAPADAADLLVTSPTQLDVTAPAGTSTQAVTLFNTSRKDTEVSADYRSLGRTTQIGRTVTEPVSAPDPSLPVPAEGATAAAPVTFDVPKGLDRLNADLRIPDPANSTILSFTLIDPKGSLTQISYDYGTPPTRAGRLGTVSDIQHVEVTAPVAGRWTARVLWANGRAHLQEPPNVPGTYTGDVSFRVTGQHYVTAPAVHQVRIKAHSSATVPLRVSMPAAPGDHPESVQFVAGNGARTSVPVARRTLIPSRGGAFDTTITSSVGRQVGQISTYGLDVPAGKQSLNVAFTTPDASADNPMTFWLIGPDGTVVQKVAAAPVTDASGRTTAAANLVATAPAAGRWEIDVELNLTTSGKEFTQLVHGVAGYDQPAAATAG
ncbi:Subtilase family protein [Actinacidiphila yanglinensis]|uniref:Subtilase family protein n=1 Tax=Actinacidiphila yanglinensis TaxID=310779 RepID=A0A1H6C6W8_9ACTN|nr:S8 family serine peptidase [Actinacidiphila yanglinensis]SEG68719.1 Subtilase family protein [Actinacidiphila yanglinensis]